MLKLGIYEQVINQLINNEIRTQNDKVITKTKIDPEEASRMLSTYLANTMEKYLNTLREKGSSISDLVSVLNTAIESLSVHKNGVELDSFFILDQGEKLLSVHNRTGISC